MLNNICPVCGLEFDEEYPWGKDGKTASFDICPCCGVTWGYEDCQPIARLNFRKQWIDNGMIWFNPDRKPKNYNPLLQVSRVIEFLEEKLIENQRI